MEDRKYEKSKSFKIRLCVVYGRYTLRGSDLSISNILVTAVIVQFEVNLGLVECLMAFYLITNEKKTAAFTK